MSLAPSQIETIKATEPVLAKYGNDITTVFYKDLLSDVPALKEIFNQGHQLSGHQQQALAGVLYAYAANIDNLAVLGAAIERICQRHASLYIKPEQYDTVGKYLIQSMGKVLGDNLTPEIVEAWTAAYAQVANIMIEREKVLYQSSAWLDWRDFKIAKKVKESDEITSFYLEPVDNQGPLPKFKPGQYISIRLHVPRLNYLQTRQHSLSDAYNEKYYRISIKRETGLNLQDPEATAHPGFCSNTMHDLKREGDIIQISPPQGDFFLEPSEANGPVVLISAGVGITPMISILRSLVQAGRHDVPTTFIHVSRNTKTRAFTEEVRALSSEAKNVRTIFFHSSPAEDEREGVDYDFRGRLDLHKLEGQDDDRLALKSANAMYYVLGPERFMDATAASLASRGVGVDRIKMEVFGVGNMKQEQEK